MEQLQINEVRMINEALQSDKAANLVKQTQSIDALIEHGFTVAQWIAFTGAQIAVAKSLLNKARKKEYLTTVMSLGANSTKRMGPMLIKDYVAASCEQAEHDFDLTERTNRAATHHLDFVRTAISALKEEARVSNYQNGQAR